MVTFICADCKVEVTHIVGVKVPDPALCASCEFIRAAPEEDRAALRRALKVDE